MTALPLINCFEVLQVTREREEHVSCQQSNECDQLVHVNFERALARKCIANDRDRNASIQAKEFPRCPLVLLFFCFCYSYMDTFVPPFAVARICRIVTLEARMQMRLHILIAGRRRQSDSLLPAVYKPLVCRGPLQNFVRRFQFPNSSFSLHSPLSTFSTILGSKPNFFW